MKYKRVFIIVIDSLGVGEMHDADLYGDKGADTLGHILRECKEIKLPNLVNLGIANLHKTPHLKPKEKFLGYACYLNEKSKGKDTMTGHWEMMGLETTVPFKVFTESGFPKELIDLLSEKTGREIVGNKSASGTEIIDELAEEEIEKGKLIVYTSADSVLQICGHEEHMGLDTLYDYCKTARELTMREEWKVGRVIARPYIGDKIGGYKRTSNRHDYALSPSEDTVLDLLKNNDFEVISVGKIDDIFAGKGITKSNRSKSSVNGMEQAIEMLDEEFKGLCFVNLVDFDALWGHRRDVKGYAKELEKFDELLGSFIPKMKNDDLLILTSDHGNDPTFKGTDHTREKAFMLSYSPSMKGFGILKDGESFGDIGATVAENFSIELNKSLIGKSILNELK